MVWGLVRAQAMDPHWILPVMVTVALYTWVVGLGDDNMGDGCMVMITVDSLAWFWFLRDDHPTAAWWALGGPWGTIVAILAVWAVVDVLRARRRKRQMALGNGTKSDLTWHVHWGGQWNGRGARVARHGVSAAVHHRGTLSPATVCLWYLSGLSVELLWMAVVGGCTDADIRAHALGEAELEWEEVAATYANTTLWTADAPCPDSRGNRCAGCAYKDGYPAAGAVRDRS